MSYNQIVEDFRKHCSEVYPLECCGIVTKELKYIPGNNISPEPKESFILDYAQLMQYDNNILFLCHSHPGDAPPMPSKGDNHCPLFQNYKFIVGNSKKLFIYWFNSTLDDFIIEPFEEQHVEDLSKS